MENTHWITTNIQFDYNEEKNFDNFHCNFGNIRKTLECFFGNVVLFLKPIKPLKMDAVLLYKELAVQGSQHSGKNLEKLKTSGKLREISLKIKVLRENSEKFYTFELVKL